MRYRKQHTGEAACDSRILAAQYFFKGHGGGSESPSFCLTNLEEYGQSSWESGATPAILCWDYLKHKLISVRGGSLFSRGSKQEILLSSASRTAMKDAGVRLSWRLTLYHEVEANRLPLDVRTPCLQL